MEGSDGGDERSRSGAGEDGSGGFGGSGDEGKGEGEGALWPDELVGVGAKDWADASATDSVFAEESTDCGGSDVGRF